MTLWRISNYKTLDGIGGLLSSGRWHSRGRPILYCTENPSTALLEILVHLEIDAEDRPERFQTLMIEGPDSLSIDTISLDPIPDLSETQAIGDDWLASSSSLLLRVPSVLVPETSNILVNSAHPEMAQLRIAKVYHHAFDPRLLAR
jgi:RES domain-containing protein